MKSIHKLLLSIFLFVWVNMAYALSVPSPLVETGWLEKNKKDVVILDIRYDIKSFNKNPLFKLNKKTKKKSLVKVAGHIPGARLVNYKKIRGNKMIDGRKVIKMNLSKAAFEKLMQSSGVNKDSAVVIMSKGQTSDDMTMATRLYWSMKYYGYDNMAILNGGMAQWILDKRKVSTKKSKIKKGNWLATAERSSVLATSEDVVAAIEDKNIQLLDARTLSLYLGTWRKKSYVFSDGHIPGAKNYPHELLTGNMPAKFVSNSMTKEMLQQLGLNTNDTTVAYCNSGHLATGIWFFMSELLGKKNVKLYDGSMHQWTLEKRPVIKMKME